MSLTFQGEHLAWQQRVDQEKSRSDAFQRWHGKRRASTGNPFPKVNQSDVEGNYMGGQFKVGYAFGGTSHFKNARLGDVDTPKKSRAHQKEKLQNKYIQALENRLKRERTKVASMKKNLEKRYK